MNELKRVVLGTAVHLQMFSWRTACGKAFDPAEKDDSFQQVTCKVCLRSRVYDYEYLNEYGPYAVGVINSSKEAERLEELYGARVDEMRSYTIRMFHPFSPGESVEVWAVLPSDEMAIRLGEALVSWRSTELKKEEA